jgi:hypothetical protein
MGMFVSINQRLDEAIQMIGLVDFDVEFISPKMGVQKTLILKMLGGRRTWSDCIHGTRDHSKTSLLDISELTQSSFW